MRREINRGFTRARGLTGLKGFTLIEVVVAMLLLGIMSVMAWQAVEVILNVNQRSRSGLEEELDLQRTWAQISNDLYHLRARQYADGLGGVEPAYFTGQGERLLSFSRGGGALSTANPAGLSRVTYELNLQQQLVRTVWPAFLSPRDMEGQRQVLLEEVRSVEFEQLNSQQVFDPNWPPLNEERSATSLPVMIRVSIEMTDGTTTWRLIPGVENDVS